MCQTKRKANCDKATLGKKIENERKRILWGKKLTKVFKWKKICLSPNVLFFKLWIVFYSNYSPNVRL